MAHPHWIPPGVYATPVDGDLVFLNVMADAYVCLPGGAELARLSEDRRTVTVVEPELAAELSEAGLLTAIANDRSAWSEPAPPKSSALRPEYPTPRLADLAEATPALCDLFRRYRDRSLGDILNTAGSRRPRPSATPSGHLHEVVDQFQRWVPYAPVSGKCLLRAFLLLRLLHRHGLDADWVFGVRIWPFRAHCWLQVGPLVLDDQPDRVRAYTPILVA